MQMSMAEAGRDKAPDEKNKKGGNGPSEARKKGSKVQSPQTPAEENEKEGDSPIEAHNGGNNVASPQAYQGKALD